MLKRLDTIDVATTDAGGAASIWQRNFGFKLVRRAPDIAVLSIGGSEIALKSGAAVETVIGTSGEGMAGLWLEAEDVEALGAKLQDANIKFEATRSGDKRVLTVDPAATNQVPLFIFDRKN